MSTSDPRKLADEADYLRRVQCLDQITDSLRAVIRYVHDGTADALQILLDLARRNAESEETLIGIVLYYRALPIKNRVNSLPRKR